MGLKEEREAVMDRLYQLDGKENAEVKKLRQILIRLSEEINAVLEKKNGR